jgi:hypothetical protein
MQQIKDKADARAMRMTVHRLRRAEAGLKYDLESSLRWLGSTRAGRRSLLLVMPELRLCTVSPKEEGETAVDILRFFDVEDQLVETPSHRRALSSLNCQNKSIMMLDIYIARAFATQCPYAKELPDCHDRDGTKKDERNRC